jgi:hypothetical protein
VKFEKSGKTLIGKIKDVPMDLFAKWAAEPNGERHIEKVVMEAEEVFLRAYFERALESDGNSYIKST